MRPPSATPAPAHEQASVIRDGRVRKHHVWSLLVDVTHCVVRYTQPDRERGYAGVQSPPHLV